MAEEKPKTSGGMALLKRLSFISAGSLTLARRPKKAKTGLLLCCQGEVLLLQRSPQRKLGATWGVADSDLALPGSEAAGLEEPRTGDLVGAAVKEAEAEMGPLPRFQMVGDPIITKRGTKGRTPCAIVLATVAPEDRAGWQPRLNPRHHNSWAWFTLAEACARRDLHPLANLALGNESVRSAVAAAVGEAPPPPPLPVAMVSSHELDPAAVAAAAAAATAGDSRGGSDAPAAGAPAPPSSANVAASGWAPPPAGPPAATAKSGQQQKGASQGGAEPQQPKRSLSRRLSDRATSMKERVCERREERSRRKKSGRSSKHGGGGGGENGSKGGEGGKEEKSEDNMCMDCCLPCAAIGAMLAGAAVYFVFCFEMVL